MSVSGFAAAFAIRPAWRALTCGTCLVAAVVFVPTAQAQQSQPAPQAQQPQSPPEGRVIVSGEGSITVPPAYARIRCGVTTRAKTAEEATGANSKLMAAVTSALLESGVAQKDIQTLRFSLQPVYATQAPNTETKLSGYSVSNQVGVTIRQIAKVGEILDRLVAAGATDVGNVAFLVSDPSKVMDQAREAAMADALRKAQLYARASGVSLGPVAWITEDSRFAPAVPRNAGIARAAAAEPVPVASGEDTMQVRITVGFDIAR
jgi:uncharacterized protein